MKKVMQKRRKTVRLYTGMILPNGKPDYWDVPVSPLKEPVTIRGKAIHAMEGKAGESFACTLSNCSRDKDNRKEFGFPVFFAHITKSSAYFVDKWAKGAPAHCYWARHNYKELVDDNDVGKMKAILKRDPDFMDRDFTFHPPKKREKQFKGGLTKPLPPGHPKGRRNLATRGALARARRAGLISGALAEQMLNKQIG